MTGRQAIRYGASREDIGGYINSKQMTGEIFSTECKQWT